MLKANYAQEDPAKVAVVKDLYRELKIPEVILCARLCAGCRSLVLTLIICFQLFSKFEEESFETISAEIKAAKHVPAEVFQFALNAIYKRSI